MDYSHYMYLRRQVEDDARRSVHEDTRFISFVSCFCKMYSNIQVVGITYAEQPSPAIPKQQQIKLFVQSESWKCMAGLDVT